MISLPNNGPLLPLCTLQRDEVARVVEVLGDAHAIHRLSEMGLRSGAIIHMVRPGTPCIVGMCGKRLSLRLEAGTEILVEPAAEESVECCALSTACKIAREPLCQ